MVGAAIYASIVQPPIADSGGTGAGSPESIRQAIEAATAHTTGFDPFLEGPVPLKIILVASQGKGKPLFGLPRIWMSVHHNEYISNEMERGLYGPSWWFKVIHICVYMCGCRTRRRYVSVCVREQYIVSSAPQRCPATQP